MSFKPKPRVVIELSDKVGIDRWYWNVCSFYAGGAQHKYFQAMVNQVENGSSTSLTSDFFISFDLIDKLMIKDGELNTALEVPPFRTTIGAKITLDYWVEYHGISLDSVVGKVHSFRVPEDVYAGFGYGKYTGVRRDALCRELRIPVGLVKKISK